MARFKNCSFLMEGAKSMFYLDCFKINSQIFSFFVINKFKMIRANCFTRNLPDLKIILPSLQRHEIKTVLRSILKKKIIIFTRCFYASSLNKLEHSVSSVTMSPLMVSSHAWEISVLCSCDREGKNPKMRKCMTTWSSTRQAKTETEIRQNLSQEPILNNAH